MLPYAVECLSLERSEGPLHRRLYESLRSAILDGSLSPGMRLPASRELAGHLGVSRNTVVSAFDQLQAEGYVTARVGHGTRVATIPPENLIACARPAQKSNEPPAVSKCHLPKSKIFEPGVPDVTLFPHRLWARLLARATRNTDRQCSPYDEPMGDPALRHAIVRHLQAYRGVRCDASRVVITTSAQAGMMMVARRLLKPGDPVWVEEPGYPGAWQAFQGAHAHIVPVPVDSQGLNPIAAPDMQRPKLIYLTPSHQFPLGSTMPLARRLELLDRAGRDGAYILEDDYDSEFRFAGRPVAALQGLDRSGRVLYMGTFSKTLMPALRVGYLVFPESVPHHERLETELPALQPPAAIQAALADFITEGHYAAHIRRMRIVYARRLAALEDAMRRLPRGVRLARCSTGLQVPLHLGPNVDDQALAMQGSGEGLALTPLSIFSLSPEVRQGLLLGFASTPEDDMPGHVKTLMKVLASQIRTR